MRVLAISTAVLTTLLLSGTALSDEAASKGAAKKKSSAKAATAKATIESRSGSKVTGTATFTEKKGGGVHVVVAVAGASEGDHAVHLHEKGDCSAPDASSAGSHFNPTGDPHGAPTADKHHAGDFGNMKVGADGKGHLELDTTMLTVGDGDHSVKGKAIIVHEKVDDLQTQPTGNAGGRIGCGVVK